MSRRSIGFGILLLLAVAASAADRHEGVASCAGGTCHAATRPLGESGIRQDEYFIWQQRDAHARATATLSNAQSQRMGATLGIKPAEAQQCLVCHSESVAPALRGERWLASDGIGCETCHGGSERWLAAHTEPGMTLAQKAAKGMTPTWQPETRAALCLGCHQGDARHPISHAMMAAGHPPLLFELDTFTALQPAHHDRDADYRARKSEQDPARDWAVGQGMAASILLTHIERRNFGQGLFPDLMQFDCDACHHDMSGGRWQASRNAGAAPGTPPLADGALHWLTVWLRVAAPATAASWQRQMAALQGATAADGGKLSAAARSAQATLQGQVMPLLNASTLDAPKLHSLLRAIAATGDSPRSRDFLTAQQTAMAALVIGDALSQRGTALSAAQQNAIDKLFAAVRVRETFAPSAYQSALQQLLAATR